MRILSFIVLFFSLCLGTAQAQFNNSGFRFQANLAEMGGVSYADVRIAVRFTLYDTTSASLPLYQETHLDTTGRDGTIDLVIGTGIFSSNAPYNAIDAIPLDEIPVGLRVEIDLQNDGSFDFTQQAPLLAVPYAYHSRTTDKKLALNSDIEDFNVNNPQLQQLMRWNGNEWEVQSSIFPDSATYAHQGVSVLYSDTSEFGYTYQELNVDSAEFAYDGDSAAHADLVMFVPTATSTAIADTTPNSAETYVWDESGNGYMDASRGAVLGSGNYQNLDFRTNATQRMRLDTAGRLHINTSDSAYGMNIYADGIPALWVQGDLDSGEHRSLSHGSHFYWSSKRGSLLAGELTDAALWTESNTGQQSLAFGRNSWVNTDMSIAIGDSCVIKSLPEPYPGWFYHLGKYSVALGRRTEANGRYCFVQGYESICRPLRSIAMGYQAMVVNTGYSCVAIGKGARVDADRISGFAIGTDVFADGSYTTALGTNAHTDSAYGTFVWGDFSTTDTIRPPSKLKHQFIVRATGGVIFYSDTNASVGVSLAAGGGACGVR